MYSPFEVGLLLLLVIIIVFIFRNRQFHEKANLLAASYCKQNNLQFLDGSTAFRGISLDRKRLHLCRSFRFDYSLNSVDRYHGVITLCGDHIQSFHVNPEHLQAVTVFTAL